MEGSIVYWAVLLSYTYQYDLSFMVNYLAGNSWTKDDTLMIRWIDQKIEFSDASILLGSISFSVAYMLQLSQTSKIIQLE